MKYRSEIDGLRALAVVPVILFHAGLELFSGGFVGVDVFFVISGYLITTILIEEIESDRFSLVDFYERRARRILPALFLVVAICVPFAWMLMLPSQLYDFLKSLLAVGLFASNVLFWQESGYFAAATEEKPLLHTWSLAVEEQYYVLFPLFLMFAWRFGRQWVFWALVLFAAASLALSEWGWRNSAGANFYLAPTRAWELFAGSIAAFVVRGRGVTASNTLSALGLIAILYAIFVFDENTPFPSVYALLPVLGTVALILFADRATWAAKLLSLRAVVGIGLISYSAYLWHQPLFAFTRIGTAHTAPPAIYLALSVVTLGLAWLSWRYVERPFRNRQLVTSSSVFKLSFAGIVCLMSIGVFGIMSDSLNDRFTQAERQLASPRVGDSTLCHDGFEAEDYAAGEYCFVSIDPSAAREIAVIGDSHAGVLTDALRDELAESNNGFYTYNGAWCAPLLHYATNSPGRNDCIGEVTQSYEQILNNPKINKVILFAEWAVYDHGYRWNDNRLSAFLFSPSHTFDWQNADVANNLVYFQQALTYTLEKIASAGKDVVIILPVPEFEFYVPSAANPKAPFVNDTARHLSLEDYFARSHDIREILISTAATHQVAIVDPTDTLCDDATCYPYDDQHAFYIDGNHLSYHGASLITPLIVDALSLD